MKIKELLEISRNERIGLICIIILLIGILLLSFFTPPKEESTVDAELIKEMHTTIDSVKTDTIKLIKKRKTKKQEKIPILTVSSLEKTETFE